MPRRDLIVSPLHRVVLSGPAITAVFGRTEVLVLAKALTGRTGIRRMNGKRRIVYYSLLLARHEVIFAEGAATESFRPGPVAMAGFDDIIKAQIYAIYPRLMTQPTRGLGPPARPIMGRAATEDFVATGQPLAQGRPLPGLLWTQAHPATP